MAQVTALSQPPPKYNKQRHSILVVVSKPGSELSLFGKEIVKAASVCVVFLPTRARMVQESGRVWAKTLRVARCLSHELQGQVDFIRAESVDHAVNALSHIHFDHVYVDKTRVGEQGKELAERLKLSVSDTMYVVGKSKAESASLARLSHIYSF